MGRAISALAALLCLPTPSMACFAGSQFFHVSFAWNLIDEMWESPVIAKVKIKRVTDDVTNHPPEYIFDSVRVETEVIEAVKGTDLGNELSVAWVLDSCNVDDPKEGETYFVAGNMYGSILWGEWLSRKAGDPALHQVIYQDISPLLIPSLSDIDHLDMGRLVK